MLLRKYKAAARCNESLVEHGARLTTGTIHVVGVALQPG